MNTWGDGEFQHIESFKEWQSEDIVPINKSSWTPPSRNQEGHRIASSLGYVPIETRKLPWRWKLAEIPMRLLARWAMKQDDIKLITGEEPADFKPPLNIGVEMHRQIGQYYADIPPDDQKSVLWANMFTGCMQSMKKLLLPNVSSVGRLTLHI